MQAGHVTIPWDALERWYEEDEEVFVHPETRSGFERDGRPLADSDAPIVLFETGLPTRYYVPEHDVDGSVHADSDLQTGCPYKGSASYRDVVLDGRKHPNLFWYDLAPLPEVSEIAGYLAPYGARVDLIVDGELQERPEGPLGARGTRAKHVA